MADTATPGSTPPDGSMPPPSASVPGSAPPPPVAGAPGAKPADKGGGDTSAEQKPALSPRLAKAMAAEAKLQQEREQIAKEKAELEAWKKERAELEGLKEKDLRAYAEKLGISYEKLTEAVLGAKEPNPHEQALSEERKKREELEQRLKGLEEQRKAEQKAETERREAEFIAQGVSQVKAAPKEFGLLLAEPDGLDMVYGYLNAYAAKHGKVPEGGYLEAARHVQQALKEERYGKVLQSAEARAILGLGGATTSSTERAAPAAKSESGQNPSSPRTLTNALATELPPPEDLRNMSEADRMALVTAYARSRKG